ncbi:hypothetical protein CsatA_015287 [Cannabis sativa]
MKRGLLLTGGGDKVMRLWSLGNYKCLEEYSTPDSTSVVDFDFDEYKIVGLLGTRICIWRRDGARSVFLLVRVPFPRVYACDTWILRLWLGVKMEQFVYSICPDAYRVSDVLMCERRSTGTQRFFSRQCQHLKSFVRSTGFQAKNKRFHRLDITFFRTMRILWENRVSPNVLYSLQHLRNDSSTLVVGGIDGILRVLNQNTGEVVSKIVLAGSISSSRDKNGIFARTRGARLAEDVHTLRIITI